MSSSTYQETSLNRRTRSVHRDQYHDEDYAKARRSDFHRHRRSRSSSLNGRELLRNAGEQALAVVGLGGAATALAGPRSRSRGRSSSGAKHRHSAHTRRSHSSSSSSYSSRSRSRDGSKIKQALQAAITAGAVEAFRDRHEPGGWSGHKGERVFTAAVTAAGVDAVIDRDPDTHSKRHIAESALAGLAANRVINGPRTDPH